MAASPRTVTDVESSLKVRAGQLAARRVVQGRRVEMQALADELGVSRVTLFRNGGTREDLLGAALWTITERTLVYALSRSEAQRPSGALHSIGMGREMNALVSESTVLHVLLEREPAATIRILTDPRGHVQPGVVGFVEDVLRRDMREFGLVAITDPGDLAFALVRLGESFLYADVLASRRPDVEAANRLQQALVEAALPAAPRDQPQHEQGRDDDQLRQ